MPRRKSRPIGVAVAQIDTKLGDVRANLELIRRISSDVKRKNRGVDIVAFPELSTTGYNLGKKWPALAEEVPGGVTDELSRIASENGLYLICGVNERGGKENIYDSSVFFDPNGRLVGVYRKVHLWGDERKYFTRGSAFPVFKTDLCTIGMGICYDLEFPEPARIMARKGAELLFFVSAEPTNAQAQVEVYLKSRSSENCVYTAFSNRVGSEGKLSYFGESQVNSPDTRTLAQVKGRERFASAEVDLGALDGYRKLLPYLGELVPEAYSVD